MSAMHRHSLPEAVPHSALPPCVLEKATTVFMYFSLLSGKDTLYSIFFDSPENIVSSTILSPLIYTRTTGANNSIFRVNISESLTLLYVLLFCRCHLKNNHSQYKEQRDCSHSDIYLSGELRDEADHSCSKERSPFSAYVHKSKIFT